MCSYYVMIVTASVLKDEGSGAKVLLVRSIADHDGAASDDSLCEMLAILGIV